MTKYKLRICLLADSHLGYDQTQNPRIHRRRRGPDFFQNYLRILKQAQSTHTDLIVHGGDLFFRSNISTSLLQQAFEPLMDLAEKNIPVYIVPGNHERSAIPYPLLTQHPNIHIFKTPNMFTFQKNSMQINLAGFPCARNNVRNQFPHLLEQTGWKPGLPGASVLCFHQAVDGAVVGIQNYMFKNRPDVINTADIPSQFHAILAGHIHRHQVLPLPNSSSTLNPCVYYPGSIERTAFAERLEPKGFLLLDLHFQSNGDFNRLKWSFQCLPTRPMVILNYSCSENNPQQLLDQIALDLKKLDANAVVRIIISDLPPHRYDFPISSRILREIAPDSMNIELRLIQPPPTEV